MATSERIIKKKYDNGTATPSVVYSVPSNAPASSGYWRSGGSGYANMSLAASSSGFFYSGWSGVIYERGSGTIKASGYYRVTYADDTISKVNTIGSPGTPYSLKENDNIIQNKYTYCQIKYKDNETKIRSSIVNSTKRLVEIYQNEQWKSIYVGDNPNLTTLIKEYFDNSINI